MRFNSIQARALLIAIALTVTVSPALAAPFVCSHNDYERGECYPETPMLAAPIPTCEQIREQAKKYTPAQIRAIAKRARLTPEQWAQVENCLWSKT